ncbi:MAG: hypothetical protein ACT4OM_02475 [Actinomycetota bacterium]
MTWITSQGLRSATSIFRRSTMRGAPGARGCGLPGRKGPRRSLGAGLVALLLVLSGCSQLSDPPGQVRGANRFLPIGGQVSPPAPEVQAFADRTMMTDLARDIFYRTRPELYSRQNFTSSCPARERRQILGCYVGGRIFVLQVDRTELASIMDVTAAHEMLHAAYDELDQDERRRVDGWTTSFYERTGSRDGKLRTTVEHYPPEERVNELHSLLGTQVVELSSELETYYARYFTSRIGVLQAHQASDEVFDEIESRHAVLVGQIQALAAEIDSLVAQQSAESAEAESLSGQIQSLRDEGQVEESNALVPRQNAAAGRASSLQQSINAKVEQHNAKVREINELVFRQDELVRSLSPVD